MDHERLQTLTVGLNATKRDFLFRQGSSDEGALVQIFQHGAYDLRRLHRHADIEKYVAKQSKLGRRMLIIDAGANIGASAVFFSLAYPTAAIVAIEPVDANFDLLCRNVEGLNVRCIHGALSSSPGKAKVIDPGQGFWGMRTEPAAADELGVPCVCIDEIFEAECKDGVEPFIVKIDIEGAEADVFSQNTSWVEKTPIIITELHDWLLPKVGTSRSFLQCVSKQDRDFVFRGEDVYSIRYDLS